MSQLKKDALQNEWSKWRKESARRRHAAVAAHTKQLVARAALAPAHSSDLGAKKVTIKTLAAQKAGI